MSPVWGVRRQSVRCEALSNTASTVTVTTCPLSNSTTTSCFIVVCAGRSVCVGRSVCREVSVWGHADTGGCVLCVHLFVSWTSEKEEQGCFQSEIWQWGLTSTERGTVCRVTGKVPPLSHICLPFFSLLYVNIVPLFSLYVHTEQVHFSCNNRRSCFRRKVTGHAGIKTQWVEAERNRSNTCFSVHTDTLMQSDMAHIAVPNI